MPPTTTTSSSSLAPPPHAPHLRQPRPSSPRPPSPSLYPPFYGRPPTPLPPSPSLTSLLRPSFTPSRPSTPDSSDSDTIPVSSSFSLSKPRYAPKVPTYEYYGFVLYVLSNIGAGVYVAWALMPKEVLEGLGINYYPSRWWAVVVPCWLVVGVVYIFVALAAVNVGVLTKPLGALETVVDEAGMVAAVGGEGERRREGEVVGEGWGDEGRWKELWGRGTDAVMDVPLGGVCEVLYGDEREREEGEEEGDVVDGEVVY